MLKFYINLNWAEKGNVNTVPVSQCNTVNAFFLSTNFN